MYCGLWQSHSGQRQHYWGRGRGRTSAAGGGGVRPWPCGCGVPNFLPVGCVGLFRRWIGKGCLTHPWLSLVSRPLPLPASSSSRRLRYRFTSPSLIHAGPASARAPLPLQDAGARDALDGTPGLKARLSRTRTPPQRPARPRLMPLAGVALAPLLVTHLAPSAPRSCAATAAGRRPSAIRGARCSATAASGEAGELSRATLLWRAAKLPIYSVALVPLTVSHLHDQLWQPYLNFS